MGWLFFSIKMTYYLLTFNEDWADEHNVPALACFDETEYQTWLETEMIIPNLNYELEHAEYQLKLQKYNEYIAGATERGLMSKPTNDCTDEELEWLKNNKCSYPYNCPKRGESKIYASLGNSGDYFNDRFNHCQYGHDFITQQIVKVFKVNQDFYEYFHLAKLNNLSLCNVFNIEE